MSVNDNAKTFGSVLAMLAVIGGVYTMVNPMNQRIEDLNDDIQEIKTTLVRTADATDIATIKEKFGIAVTNRENLQIQINELREWRKEMDKWLLDLLMESAFYKGKTEGLKD